MTGTPVADEISAFANLPVAVENDANALAVAEKFFGAAALMRCAGAQFASAEDVISAANGGNTDALAAVHTLGHYLARGCSLFTSLFDPEALILSGGLCVNNPELLRSLQEQLQSLVPVWEKRCLSIVPSQLGY